MKERLMIIGCVAALLGFSQAALAADPFYDELRAKRSDPAKWTYPDWSDGLPQPPKESNATIEAREKSVDYLALLEGSWKHFRSPDSVFDEHASTGSLLKRGIPSAYGALSSISLAAEIYERTGNRFYLDYAAESFTKFLKGAVKLREKGVSFGEINIGAGTGTYKYANALYRLTRHMKLTGELRTVARELGAAFSHYPKPVKAEPGRQQAMSFDGKHFMDTKRMYQCGNHSTRQFVGTALVAKVFEKDPEIKWLVDVCNFGWKWYQWKQSVQENDNSYGFLCLNPMIQLARAHGVGIEAFEGEGYRALLERYAYLTTPSGYYPQFGYAIGVHALPEMVLVAEVAARATEDPACLYFAHKLNNRLLRTINFNRRWIGAYGNWISAYDSAYCTYLLNMPKTDLRPAVPKVLSKVYRCNEWNLDKESTDKIEAAMLKRQIPDKSVIRLGYDKLVLKTSNAPGGAMIMMDLASRKGGADKSHPEKRPAVQYYEAHHTPLWYGFKYTRSSQSSNLVWLTPPDLDFPHMENCKDVQRLNKINSTWDCRVNPQNLKYGDALAENKGADAYGFIEFERYYRPDTSLTRRLLLTQEGILVIRDDLMPGKSVDGYSAGALWNPLQAMGRAHTDLPDRNGGVPQPETGENWWDFAAPKAFPGCDLDDTNVYASELMVYHARARGRGFGAKHLPEPHGHARPWLTTYSCETIKAGNPVTFITVLIPHPPEVTGKMLADNISINVKGGVSIVSLMYKGQTLRMEMGKDGKSWQVLRQ